MEDKVNVTNGWVPMHYPWQNGSCKNYTFKATNLQQSVYGLGQLPIILTCMIAHGHEDKRYAQYLNELWPNDPNFTIGSLLWLFRTLEVASLLKSKLFLEEPPCITYSLHISYKGNYIAYINYAHKNKLLVPSLCQEICCLKWITKWRTAKISICWHFFHC
jgi:hypothetical protein